MGMSPIRDDWRDCDKPWKAKPHTPSNEPEDKHTFFNVIHQDNKKIYNDENKRKEDEVRFEQKNEVHNMLQHPSHLLFIQSDDDMKELIGLAKDQLEKFVKSSWRMKSKHDDRVKILYDKLKAQEALVLNLNGRTASLLGTLHNM